MRNFESDDCALVVSPTSIPWRFWEKYYLEEYQFAKRDILPRAGRNGRLGKLDVFYTGRFLRTDEFLIVPKMSFIWKIKERIKFPRFEMIGPASETGRKIAEQNPEMDLRLKCLVYPREEGSMRFTGNTDVIRLLKPTSDFTAEEL